MMSMVSVLLIFDSGEKKENFFLFEYIFSIKKRKTNSSDLNSNLKAFFTSLSKISSILKLSKIFAEKDEKEICCDRKMIPIFLEKTLEKLFSQENQHIGSYTKTMSYKMTFWLTNRKKLDKECFQRPRLMKIVGSCILSIMNCLLYYSLSILLICCQRDLTFKIANLFLFYVSLTTNF